MGKKIKKDYEVEIPWYGFAASPVIEGNLIILTANTSGLALDKKTGERIWDSKKPTGTDYSTPVIYDYEGTRYAVISSKASLQAMEVETGNQLWLYDWGITNGNHMTDPLIFNNKIFITLNKEPLGCILIDIGGQKPIVLWKNRNMFSEISSPVMIDGYIYGCHGGPEHGFGSRQCLDIKTGELVWEEELKKSPISLIAANGKLIILEDDGIIHIAKTTHQSYMEISSFDVLEGEQKIRKFFTPPVLYKGKIYCRNFDGDLICIDISK